MTGTASGAAPRHRHRSALQRASGALAGKRRLLEPLAAALLLLAAILGLQQVQNAFPLAEAWAERQIAAGAAPEARREALAEAFRATYGYETRGGDWSPYVVGSDSYYYLRLAEGVLKNGTPCSPAVAEACWDTQANAPDGRPLVDALSPHPYAIAFLHRLLLAIDGDRVLLDSGRLLNLLLLALGGFLLFLLARSLAPAGAAGTAGALLAALATCLNPFVVSRSYGTDDDVWTLALVAAGVLLAARAIDGTGTPARRAGWATAAGLACGALALSWGGWPFLLLLLTGAAGLAALLDLLARQGRTGAAAWRSAVTPLCVLLGFALVTAAAGAPLELAEQLGRLRGLLPLAGEAPPPGPPAQDAFASVAELQAPTAARLLEVLGLPALLLAPLGLAYLALQGRPRRGGALLLLFWLLGALVLVRAGERHLLLLIPPLTVLAGIGLARLLALLAPRSRRLYRGAAVLTFLVAGAMVGQRAVAEVADNRPAIDSAWVQVLTEIRRATPPDTLLLSTWDSGHWAAFWSGRGVAVDGASLRTPRLGAMAHLLAADADGPLDPAVRAVACGAEPPPCRTGPLLLVTSSELLTNDSWMIAGLWRPELAAAVDALAAGRNGDDVRAELIAAGVDTRRAERLLEAGRLVSGRRERALLAAPAARIWSRGWQPCARQPDGSYHCPLALDSTDGWRLESLSIDPGRPAEAAFAIRRQDGTGEGRLLRPSMIRLAGPETLVEVRPAAEGDGNPGILLDTAGARVFVGTPPLLRSLVVRLIVLEGRYDRGRFEPLVQARTIDGASVQAWRVLTRPGG